MKKTLGAMLVVLGILSFMSPSFDALNAPNVSFLLGNVLPGLFFLMFGLAHFREQTPSDPEGSAGDAQKPAPPGEGTAVHPVRDKGQPGHRRR